MARDLDDVPDTNCLTIPACVFGSLTESFIIGVGQMSHDWLGMVSVTIADTSTKYG